jgi:hypothetical protein
MSMMVVLYLAAGRAFADLATIMYGFLDWNLRGREMQARGPTEKDAGAMDMDGGVLLRAGCGFAHACPGVHHLCRDMGHGK